MIITLKKKYIRFNNYKVKCAIGKSGIKKNKREGDKFTPKGKFRLNYVLYRSDRVKKISTKLKKIIIRKKMGWCDDPRSKKYNQLIEFPFGFRAEKMYLKENTYDIFAVFFGCLVYILAVLLSIKSLLGAPRPPKKPSEELCWLNWLMFV